MRLIISLLAAIALLLAGLSAIFSGNSRDPGTVFPETEAPPLAASGGPSFTPRSMPEGPHEAGSIVISYNLSDVLQSPATNVWGGQQTRIARLGEDLYLLFGTRVLGIDDEEYTLYRYSGAANTWTRFYSLRSHEVPGLHIVGGRVYAAYRYTRGLGILEYDPDSDRITLHDSGIFWPTQHEKDHWAYMSTGISGDRTIWFLGCGNINGTHGRPGSFAVYSYDTVTRAFGTGGAPRHHTDFRHCYNYILDGGEDGIVIAGERDIFWNVSEWDMPEGAFGAIFDEINYWTFKDNKLSDIRRVDKAMQGQNCPAPNAAINYAGDVFLDSNGCLHILYTLVSAHTGGRSQLWHAVYEDGMELKKECLLDDGQQHSVRLVEDSEGQLYLVVLPYNSHTISLFTVDNQHEATLLKEIEIAGDDSIGLQYAGMAATVPRSGSEVADYVDVIYPNIDRTDWIYFRLQLK